MSGTPQHPCSQVGNLGEIRERSVRKSCFACVLCVDHIQQGFRGRSPKKVYLLPIGSKATPHLFRETTFLAPPLLSDLTVAPFQRYCSTGIPKTSLILSCLEFAWPSIVHTCYDTGSFFWRKTFLNDWVT